MGVAEVERFEELGRGLMGLIRLWKSVEKRERRVGSEYLAVNGVLKPRLGALATRRRD